MVIKSTSFLPVLPIIFSAFRSTLNRFFLLVVFWGSTQGLLAQTATWTGTSSTSWDTPANWNPAQVPLISDDVVIPSAPTNQPVLSTTAVANSVEVKSG